MITGLSATVTLELATDVMAMAEIYETSSVSDASAAPQS